MDEEQDVQILQARVAELEETVQKLRGENRKIENARWLVQSEVVFLRRAVQCLVEEADK